MCRRVAWTGRSPQPCYPWKTNYQKSAIKKSHKVSDTLRKNSEKSAPKYNYYTKSLDRELFRMCALLFPSTCPNPWYTDRRVCSTASSSPYIINAHIYIIYTRTNTNICIYMQIKEFAPHHHHLYISNVYICFTHTCVYVYIQIKEFAPQHHPHLYNQCILHTHTHTHTSIDLAIYLHN